MLTCSVHDPQETQAVQNEQLAKVKPTDFANGLAIMSNDNNNWRLKYMYATCLKGNTVDFMFRLVLCCTALLLDASVHWKTDYWLCNADHF